MKGKYLVSRALVIGVSLSLGVAATVLGDDARREKRIENSVGMKLVFIPPGEFQMGMSVADVEKFRRARLNWEYFADSQPQHRVRITRAFYMGVHEVTQAQYERVMGKNPSDFKEGDGKEKADGKDTRQFPVENVSWKDALEFTRRLSATAAEKAALRRYRLPTEAEWEYACRAGTTTAFHFGDIDNGREANVNGNYPFGTAVKGPYIGRTTPVGSYKANAFGLFDMHGNVWEWCEDYYDEEFYAKKVTDDPRNDTKPKHEYHVLRGGSWLYGAGDALAAYRNSRSPNYQSNLAGCRVCSD